MSQDGHKLDSLPAIELRGDWDILFEGWSREWLEREVLPGFVRRQRWFGGKARALERIEIADWGRVAIDSAIAYFVLLDVHFKGPAGTSRDRYFLPLAISGIATAGYLEPSALLARVSCVRGEGVLHDALADDALCVALLDAIGAHRTLPTQAGMTRGLSTSAFERLRRGLEPPLLIEHPPATSSNTLVFYEGQLLLKVFRRLEVGINPDFEIGRFLTEEHPFEHVPTMAGTLVYEPREGPGPVTLAILQAVVPNRGDGWRHALPELERFYQRAAGQYETPDRVPDARSLVGEYRQAAAILGRRTAELHLALSDPKGGEAFAAEPLSGDDIRLQRDDILAQGQAALDALRQQSNLAGAVAADAHQLLEEGPGALEALLAAPLAAPRARKIRVHGDYHLGQVLWTDDDYVLIDFEGEPTRTVAERRRKASPLRDVAGMLRSYHYAAYAGLFEFVEGQPTELARLEPWAELWQCEVSAEFLRAYRHTLGDTELLPREPDGFAALLRSFLLSKAFYELLYELNNRPTWVRIPLRGVLALLRRDQTPGETDSCTPRP